MMCPYCGENEEITDVESGNGSITFLCYRCGNEFTEEFA